MVAMHQLLRTQMLSIVDDSRLRASLRTEEGSEHGQRDSKQR